jgi:single-strand DNA-binding protein
MASLNKIQIIGNVGRDPEVRTFPSGDRVANVTVACTESWKDKQTGEKREATEWFRVVFRAGLAGVVEQYVRKGSQIYVEGSLKTRKYNDAAGVEKQITEVMANEMKMLGGRPEGSAPAPATRPSSAPAPSGGSSFDDFGDGGDIPFIDPLHHRALCLAI